MKRKFQISLAAAAVAVSAAALPVLAASLADCVKLDKYLLGEEQQIELSGNDRNGDEKLDAVDLTLMKRDMLSEEPAAADDFYVSQITFGADGVTLKNAADQIVEAEKAQNVTVDGTKVTVIRPTANKTDSFGDINLDGECAQGQIVVDVDETTYADGQVTLNLRGLKLSNSSDSPVYISQIADECVITVKNGTENVISDGTEYENADKGAGAIYSLDDLKIKGKGKLTVNGNCGDGIVCKDDLKIWNGDIQVTAEDDAIRGKDSVRIGDPDAESYESLVLDLTSKKGDGIKSTNDTADSGKGYIRINGGTVKVKAENGDGIQAEQAVEINGGDINIYTYQGCGYTGNGGGQSQWGGGMDGNSNKTEISAKGIKCCGLFDESGSTYLSAGDITVKGGSITVDSSDDCIHAAGNVSLSGGLLQLSSADDAVHADHNVTVGTKDAGTYDDVQIYIPKCYEGVEGVYIYQNSGTVYIVSGDDGYNAAGGADNSGNQNGQQGPGGGFHQGFMSSTFGELNLNGGLVVVNSANGDHDAFDSNGNINITGGYYVCNGQEPLDCGDGGSYSINQTGGTYLAMTAGNTSLNTTYTFKDASGNALLTFKSAGGSPGISSKDNSTCYSGTTVSDGTKLLADCPYGVTLGGSAAGGTQITAAPSSTSPFGPGGPGGRN
ncbi:MAG: carbohydrate-binding domain-containing protein [Oscillospiraceae bacterium]|nr:carbohydrate-binding domain-containing protein [Oscillospiraceae bacterium]